MGASPVTLRLLALLFTLASTCAAAGGLLDSIGRALDQTQKTLDQTQKTFDEATKAFGIKPERETAGSVLEKARQHYAAGRWRECVTSCDRALRLDPQLGEARELRDRAQTKLNAAQPGGQPRKPATKQSTPSTTTTKPAAPAKLPDAPALALPAGVNLEPLLRARPEAGPAATLALLSLLGKTDPGSPLVAATVYPDAEDTAAAAEVLPALLGFASARAAGATALAEADQAWQEAILAASWGNESATREALTLVHQQVGAARSADAALRAAAEKVRTAAAKAPDPVKRTAERKTDYLRQLARTRQAIGGGTDKTSGYRLAERRNNSEISAWTGVSLATGQGPRDTLTTVQTWSGFTRTDRLSWEMPETIVPGLPARIAMEAASTTTAEGGSFCLGSIELVLPGGRECIVTGAKALYNIQSPGFGIHTPTNAFVLTLPEALRQLTPAGAANTRLPLRLPSPSRSGDMYNLTRAHNGIDSRPDIRISDVPLEEVPLSGRDFAPGPAGPSSLVLRILSNNDLVATYRYEWSNDIVLGADGEPEPLSLPLEKEQDTAIAFHQAAISQLERNLGRERAELARTADPTTRARLEWRILHIESDLQAEKDLLATLKTGVPVHTPGPFDHHARDLFAQHIRENQLRMESCLRAEATLPRLIGLLPPDRQAEAKAFVDRQLTPQVRASFDADQVRRISEALHKQVDGYWRGEAARHEEQALRYDDLLTRAERVKLITDVSVSIAGAGTVTALRGAALYAGTSGLALGGPEQALRDASLYLNAPLHAALSAVQAYPQGGWTGAAKAGAVGWLMSRVATLGTSAPPPATAAEKLTVQQVFQLAEFKQAQQRGQDLVKAFQSARAEVASARTAGRSMAEIGQLERKAADWAAAVQSDMHAKSFLKFKADLPLQQDFMAHINVVHLEVEAQFHALMAARKWDAVQLQAVRNAASAGSVNMDFDIMLVEAAARRLMKDGKPMSLHAWQQEAQAAWDEAYRAVTGRSAGHALEEITTSLHPEAYKDLAWITADKAGLSKLWATQAGDVTIYKGANMLSSLKIGAVDPLTRAMEASRGTAKDITTKVLDRLNAATMPPARKAELTTRWTQIRDLLKEVGEGKLDPVRGDRQIRSLTGGFGITEVIDHAGILLGQAAKL